MDKFSQLKTAVDEILEDDHVFSHGDEGYEVQHPDGGVSIFVRQLKSAEWAAFHESGRPVPYAPRAERPNEVVVWALLG